MLRIKQLTLTKILLNQTLTKKKWRCEQSPANLSLILGCMVRGHSGAETPVGWAHGRGLRRDLWQWASAVNRLFIVVAWDPIVVWWADPTRFGESTAPERFGDVVTQILEVKVRVKIAGL
jgi:hypothetical protein